MNKFIIAIALASCFLAGARVQAQPTHGNALRDAAEAGQITPGGVFQGR